MQMPDVVESGSDAPVLMHLENVHKQFGALAVLRGERRRYAENNLKRN